MTTGYPPHVVAKLNLPDVPDGYYWYLFEPDTSARYTTGEIELRKALPPGRRGNPRHQIVERQRFYSSPGELAKDFGRFAEGIMDSHATRIRQLAEVEELWRDDTAEAVA